MIPRQNIVCLYLEDTMSQHIATIRQSRHTRYPLCEEDKDHILGLIHIKDLMDLYMHKQTNLRQIKRPILMVPEIMPASKLLQLMRARRTYLAMVVDEYGSTVGLIGLEDILEELVGNIKNEHSMEKEEIQPLANGAYEFAGTVLLEDVEELLHIPVEEDVDTDTIGGYVFNVLGHTPVVKEEAIIGTYRFVVLEMQRFRIARLNAVPIPPEELPPPEGEGEHDKGVTIYSAHPAADGLILQVQKRGKQRILSVFTRQEGLLRLFVSERSRGRSGSGAFMPLGEITFDAVEQGDILYLAGIRMPGKRGC